MPPCWGSVKQESVADTAPILPEGPRQTVAFQTSEYHWRPPDNSDSNLPLGFSLSLTALAARDGIRRFTPSQPLPSFILQASLAGQALLSRRENLSRHQRYSYHAMRLLYQLAPKLREHLNRSFSRAQDLYVPRPGRITQDQASVLPANIGQDARGQGQPWTDGELIAHGREKARLAGDESADTAKCIRLGLLEAAWRNPMDTKSVTAAQARLVVRLALFDLGPADNSVDTATLETVEARLLHALDRHLADDTAAFNKWFFDNVDNIIHQIAKSKGEGGRIARTVVRQAILEIVFRAFTYVSQCVHSVMQDFREGICPELGADEQAHFDLLYLQQPCLAAMPLIMLFDRFDFLREIILELLERPTDRPLMGVLLRLLNYYGEMAAAKREGDRRYKRQLHHRNNQNRSAQVWSLESEQDRESKVDREPLQEIAGYHREKRVAKCKCKTTSHWRAQLIKSADKMLTIKDTCGQCDHEETVTMPWDQFQRIAHELNIVVNDDFG